MSPSTFKAAAVHYSPKLMDKNESISQTIDIIHDAKQQNVQLLVFPESFIPGYPAWVMNHAPLQVLGLISQYAQQSISVLDPSGKPSPDLKPILAACKDSGISIVLGVSERSGQSRHTLFCSQVFISGEGVLLGVHRKLMPTYAEKTIWATGGGATLKCWNMPLGTEPAQKYKIGGLICSENAIYAAKDALIMQNEQVHAASWTSMNAFMGPQYGARIKALSMSHSISAGAFVIAASPVLKKESIDWVEKKLGTESNGMVKEGSGWSGIVAPGASILQEYDGLEDKLLIAEINIDATNSPAKVIADMAGHYRRPDVFRVEVNREAVWEDDELIASGGRTS